jgi:hypothetical protein
MPPSLSTGIAFFSLRRVVNIRALLRAIDGFDGQPTMSLTSRGGLNSPSAGKVIYLAGEHAKLRFERKGPPSLSKFKWLAAVVGCLITTWRSADL